MQPHFFLDTNIFIYAHDLSDKNKTDKARSLISEAYISGKGVISQQVIREFCNAASTKFRITMSTKDIGLVVKTELEPLLINREQGGALLCLDALRIKDRYTLSFYDASIIQAATYSKCSIVYSEDMQHRAKYGPVTVINPFKAIVWQLE